MSDDIFSVVGINERGDAFLGTVCNGILLASCNGDDIGSSVSRILLAVLL
jgi:hypothetical protein